MMMSGYLYSYDGLNIYYNIEYTVINNDTLYPHSETTTE